MIFTRLEVCNFRSFRGAHSVDLYPDNGNGDVGPIVLFGGLNGAGKTTLFLAIKLALYGRATGEGGYTTSGYTSFIRSCIHKYPRAIVQPNTASVELQFQFGKLGKSYAYVVRRNWEVSKTNMKETLSIWENGARQTSLDQDEAQGLLNELIPQGIANLFLFDGEKIGLLAKDSSGDVLRTAFERLYGLDVAIRLRDDLQTHIRKNTTPLLNVAVDTAKIQTEYDQIKEELSEARSQLQRDNEMLHEAQVRREQLEINLRSQGGQWGENNHNYQIEATNRSKFLAEKKDSLRELIGGVFPLCLAQDTMRQLHKDVAADLEMTLQRHANGTVEHFADSIRVELDQKGKDSLERVLSGWLKSRVIQESIFDITPKTVARLEQVVSVDLFVTLRRCENLLESIVSDSNELDTLEQKLSRAPDKGTLKTEFDEFVQVNERISKLTRGIATLQTEMKAKLIHAIKLGSIISERHRDSIEQNQRCQSLEYAERTRFLLKTYRKTSILKTIEQLEREFDKEFCMLSRKDRSEFRIKIDPQSFQVRFQSEDRGEFNTTQLSEGEKHIYAVAMLIALAKTSQRPLPLVIDSPLVRLDSDHHKKLVENYFPYASHQVILLSTDEEIDVEAYEELSPRISRAYLIEFNDVEQESSIKEGYFLK
ncbi:MAG: DNA sulfur modification protein DndD [Gammaproteobacteria bacterium]|nr:DNA sulfur modification protein DndD [Gammaproteobacteria bacterium]MYF38349.1 DNA sulfur modification protein DndD [Gammaproteobacteria bacterium]